MLTTQPTDYPIRELSEHDASELAALHVETFYESHSPRGGGPSLALRDQQWRDAFADVARSWFAVGVVGPDGSLVGFAKGCLHDGGIPGYAGELNKIYLLKRFQRRGLGARLVAAVAGRFLDRGVRSMLLFGDAASTSNGFYEALGAQRLYTPDGEFHGGYGWLDLEALLARCAQSAT